MRQCLLGSVSGSPIYMRIRARVINQHVALPVLSDRKAVVPRSVLTIVRGGRENRLLGLAPAARIQKVAVKFRPNHAHAVIKIGRAGGICYEYLSVLISTAGLSFTRYPMHSSRTPALLSKPSANPASTDFSSRLYTGWYCRGSPGRSVPTQGTACRPS